MAVSLPANFVMERKLPQAIEGISCRAGKCTGVGSYLPAGPQKAFTGTTSAVNFGVLKEITGAPGGAGPAAITDQHGCHALELSCASDRTATSRAPTVCRA